MCFVVVFVFKFDFKVNRMWMCVYRFCCATQHMKCVCAVRRRFYIQNTVLLRFSLLRCPPSNGSSAKNPNLITQTSANPLLDDRFPLGACAQIISKPIVGRRTSAKLLLLRSCACLTTVSCSSGAPRLSRRCASASSLLVSECVYVRVCASGIEAAAVV